MKALFHHLKQAVKRKLDDDEPDIEIELWPDTDEGKPDLLIDDLLALE